MFALPSALALSTAFSIGAGSPPSPAHGVCITLDDGLVLLHEVAGVATEFEHDALGRVTAACTVAALATCWSSGGQAQAWDYDDADRVATASLQWSASGWRATTLARDDLGRAVGATHPDGSTETWGYDLAGNLARHVDEEGVEQTWSHDGWGRLSSESVPGLATGIAHAYARAQPGGLARHDVTMPDGATWTTYSAEWAGRVVSEIDPLGTETTREYDGPDLFRVAVEGPAGDALEWGYWHDAAGQLQVRAGPVPVGTVASFSAAPDPEADAIHGFAYTYTPAGRLETRAGPLGELTTWSWSGGLLDGEWVGSTTSPSAVSASSFTYDAHGLPETRALGSRLTTWERDALGRVTLERHETGSDLVETSFSDFDAHRTARALSRETGGWEESSYWLSTDACGRVDAVTLRVAGSVVAEAEYELGDDGLVDAVTVTAGSGGPVETRYTRDGYRRVASISHGGASVAGVSARDLAGRVSATWAGGGPSRVDAERECDLLGRVENLRVQHATLGTEERAYGWDWAGRLESLSVGDGSSLSAAAEYGYSDEGWLETETWSGPASSGWAVVSERVHAYDLAGNRLSTVQDGATEIELDYGDGNRLDAIDGLATTWNDRGELEDDPRGYAISRAADGLEAAIDDVAAGVSVDVARDPLGAPVATLWSDGTASTARYQLWGNPGAELPLVSIDDAGNASVNLALEGQLLGVATGATLDPVAADAMGSLVLDAGGFLGVPEAFGTGAESTSVAQAYAGLESIPEMPYQLARARAYDPTTGRFASQDPIGLAGGDHRFAYAASQPTGFSDPSGLAFGRPVPSSSIPLSASSHPSQVNDPTARPAAAVFAEYAGLAAWSVAASARFLEGNPWLDLGCPSCIEVDPGWSRIIGMFGGNEIWTRGGDVVRYADFDEAARVDGDLGSGGTQKQRRRRSRAAAPEVGADDEQPTEPTDDTSEEAGTGPGSLISAFRAPMDWNSGAYAQVHVQAAAAELLLAQLGGRDVQALANGGGSVLDQRTHEFFAWRSGRHVDLRSHPPREPIGIPRGSMEKGMVNGAAWAVPDGVAFAVAAAHGITGPGHWSEVMEPYQDFRSRHLPVDYATGLQASAAVPGEVLGGVAAGAAAEAGLNAAAPVAGNLIAGASRSGTRLLTQGWGAAEFAPGQLGKHFTKDAGEWGVGNITEVAYLKRARSLLGSEPGGEILGFTREGGDVLRYNVRTNEFAVGSAEGNIRTMFRPESGLDYWAAQTWGVP